MSQLCLQRAGNSTGSSVALSSMDSSTDPSCGVTDGSTNFYFKLLPGANTMYVCLLAITYIFTLHHSF